MSENPLKQYFRRPAIHIELPSQGRFYEDGVLDIPETGEFPVYPMTAIDDITYKTPDALFNGSSIVDVVKSCIPGIKDPWYMLSVDLNTILTAIRIASIGNEIELETVCPNCGNEERYTLDLHGIMDQKPDISVYDEPLPLGDLKVYFRPLTYKDVNESNLIQFEEAQLNNILDSDDITEEQKIELLTKAFKNIAQYSVETIAKSVKSIVTPETTVTEKEHIEEFLRNAESEQYDAIKKHLVKLRSIEELKPVHIKCEECEHEFDKRYTLDMTTFFDKDS